MAFKGVFDGKGGYHDSEDENLANDVLIPILKNSLNYDRAVGFSSSSLVETASGLSEYIEKGGHIGGVSPFNKEDSQAIRMDMMKRNC